MKRGKEFKKKKKTPLIVDIVVIFVVIRSTKIPKGFSHVFRHTLSRLNLFNWFLRPGDYQNIIKIFHNLVQPSNSGEIPMNHEITAYLI